MKDFGKGILSALFLKLMMSPTGLAILGVIFVFLLSMVFIVFPKSEDFNQEDPDSNRDILEQPNGGVFPACQPEGEINMDAMETQFNNAGVFTDMEDTFIEVAEEYEFDPVLLSAISFHETGFGTSNLVVNYNNPGGLYNSNTDDFYHFDSLAEGLDAMTSNLYENYYAEGLFTIEEIGAKYAPIGADNDPNNMNAHWVPTITQYVNKLGGLVLHCEIVNDGSFAFPIDNPYITSEYGYRIHPIDGILKMHGGTDFDCDTPDPIKAAKSGEVVYSQFNGGGFGNLVIIKHTGNIYSAYAHLSERTVNVGEQLQTGQQVGVCGTTGSSTGTHLHFEIHLNEMFGQKTDPMEYLPVMQSTEN